MNEENLKELPLVSVIIPVYNSEAFLSETLDSVLSSTYKQIEIIIIDDGSTDNSSKIASSYAVINRNISLYKQKNRGVAAARNHGILKSKGKYILPVDSDDLISTNYIADAIDVFLKSPSVKIVTSEAEYFGLKKGKWKLKPFSLSLIARKNMISCCSFFSKEDWERVGGFYEHTGREDWILWISILKDGGDFVRLPSIGHYYRIHEVSKRKKDRTKKKEVIDTLNRLYPDFFHQKLNGPLRYNRSFSKIINTIDNFINIKKIRLNSEYKFLMNFLLNLPNIFCHEGEVVYKGRNELRKFRIEGISLIVKSYRKPHLLNRIIYGMYRKSKAERAYLNANKLLKSNIGTPLPIGFITIGKNFLFDKSYFVSLESTCPYKFNDLSQFNFLRSNEIFEAIAATTAVLHENNFLHKDYSGGNILFDDRDKEIKVEIIDLNRMQFTKIGINIGCKNFERLATSPENLEIMGSKYAEIRNYNKRQCIELIKRYNHSAI